MTTALKIALVTIVVLLLAILAVSSSASAEATEKKSGCAEQTRLQDTAGRGLRTGNRAPGDGNFDLARLWLAKPCHYQPVRLQ